MLRAAPRMSSPPRRRDRARRWPSGMRRRGLDDSGWTSSSSPSTRRRRRVTRRLRRAAARAGFCYLPGGDPGLVASVLRDSPVGNAIISAWRNGAALAGSSAGAMALCAATLVRQSFPGHTERRALPGLDVVHGAAVLPHHDTFGAKWYPSARAALPDAVLIGIDERTCALWDSGAWRCLGAGGVTLYVPGSASVRATSGALDGIPQPALVGR